MSSVMTWFIPFEFNLIEVSSTQAESSQVHNTRDCQTSF